MTEERKQAESETAAIMDAVRKTGCEGSLLIAAISYAQGLIDGKMIAQRKEATA